jgi:hypothetical protein
MCGRETTTFGSGGIYHTTVPLIQYHNSAEKDKVTEKMAMKRFPHFIHKFMKIFINQAYD